MARAMKPCQRARFVGPPEGRTVSGVEHCGPRLLTLPPSGGGSALMSTPLFRSRTGLRPATRRVSSLRCGPRRLSEAQSPSQDQLVTVTRNVFES
jgi:hypothetical protein